MLTFDQRGNLKPYKSILSSIEEFAKYFVHDIKSETREANFRNYIRYSEDLKRQTGGFDLKQWIDGSFVTLKTNFINISFNTHYKEIDDMDFDFRIDDKKFDIMNEIMVKEKKHQLYLISSRFKFLEHETQRLVKNYGLDKIFDKLYFNYDNKQPHEFKDEILQKLNLDIFVDDDLSLVRHVAKHNPKTKFFWLDQHAKQQSLFYLV